MSPNRIPPQTPANPAYGSNLIRLWYHGLRDRLAGRRTRANARWGHVRAPQGSGKLIWIKTGASPLAVRLAVEIMGAIRHKRLDVRLVLTFEEEHTEILKTGLKGLKKIGFGFGPCDSPRAVKRILRRFEPLGVIVVGQDAGPHLLAALQRDGVHSAVYAGEHPADVPVEAFYPINVAAAEQCAVQNCATYIAPAADPATVLTHSQVEPTLGSLLRAGQEFSLWWLHDPDAAMVRKLRDSWRRSDFDGQAVLILSFENVVSTAAAEAACRRAGVPVVRLSQWQRQGVAAGTAVLADEERWLPAIAASVDAIHLNRSERPVFWQALAGGAPLSLGEGVAYSADDLQPRTSDLDGIFRIWRRYREDRLQARRAGDACRKRFWDERRRAMTVVDELLQRVYDW